MRLSEAMMLGSATCKMVQGDWNSCALGCAGNAVGIQHASGRLGEDDIDIDGDLVTRFTLLANVWPWIRTANFAAEIYIKFDDEVCIGKLTFEQLVDYVRSIEPDCDCNRFNCDCAKAEQAVADMELASKEA